MKSIQEAGCYWMAEWETEGILKAFPFAMEVKEGRIFGQGKDPFLRIGGHLCEDEIVVLDKAFRLNGADDHWACSGHWDGSKVCGVWHQQSDRRVAGRFRFLPVAKLEHYLCIPEFVGEALPEETDLEARFKLLEKPIRDRLWLNYAERKLTYVPGMVASARINHVTSLLRAKYIERGWIVDPQTLYGRINASYCVFPDDL